ncbi:MAG: 3-deoxy-8-phosphooctulonate synthase [Elusimicrobia bacterium]|nr:3-deoxy-8-phosphooctulonate synthase [Elusimicrobiota bacterium]MDE2424889.1 3-deoxy-8-phosphooctulonate synthase [Elusimicrobiota bacterium]
MPHKPTKAVCVRVGEVAFSNAGPLSFIAGPCALESEALLLRVGLELKRRFAKLGLPFVLKCSADKANRTSSRSFRGPGFTRGLEILARVRAKLGVPVLTDIHEPAQAAQAAGVVDALQIPAFLSRQTDLLLAAGATGKPVNIKKAQFMAPWDIVNAVRKIESTGNRNILLCERGSCFGYNNLVVDMRSLQIMAELGYPVVYDATHSVQLPGGKGDSTDGQRHFAGPLTRAAAAVGVAGVFLETHPRPERALSDGPNSIRLSEVPRLLAQVRAIDAIVKKGGTER